ncbi:MAG: hypothetical protein ACI854_001657, partial [Arenicella sp.]
QSPPYRLSLFRGSLEHLALSTSGSPVNAIKLAESYHSLLK